MFTITLENPVGPQLDEMHKRAKDWTPLADSFRRSISKSHKARRGAESPAETTGAIFDSLESPSVFNMGVQSVEYGSSVEYASYYAKWRRDNGLSELVLDTPIQEMADAFAEWILRGRT